MLILRVSSLILTSLSLPTTNLLIYFLYFNILLIFFSGGGNREYYLQEKFLDLVLTENAIDSLLCMLLGK